MLGGAGGAVSPAGEELLTVTVVRDEHGYGMKVSGDNPVYVQSVKEHGAAWRAGLRSGDRILRVDSIPVHQHTHQQVVHMIRANPTTVLTVQQHSSRHKTPITAPLPVNSEKQRQLEVSKAHTVRLMLEKEQKYIRDLKNELLKVPDVRKQAQLESSEQRCAILQHEIDTITAAQPEAVQPPTTPKLPRAKDSEKIPNTGFLSALPRSLSNLTGQSLRNLRQARQKQDAQPLVRQNSDETNNKRRHVHNNTVPMVPTTCLDNTPPPLPPRSIERPKRTPISPTMTPINPLAKPKPCSSVSPIHKQYYKKPYPMHQSMPPYREEKFRRSSHSLDGELEGPQPNSIALQMSYPLVNAPPPPLQTDNRTGIPVLHVRSQSSPEHLDHELQRNPSNAARCAGACDKEAWSRGTPPPGTPPPPYLHPAMLAQPCADPQRAIISMEEDDSPASDNSTYSGLFSNLRSVRESKARTAVLINWLLGERRCACASLLLVLTDAYRAAAGAAPHTLRRWAYELHSTFLMPNAVLQLNGVNENMANEIEHVLVNEFDKEELLRNVFRKARRQAKDELARQLSEFQVKRQVGLGTLYGPEDAVLERCDVDKAQVCKAKDELARQLSEFQVKRQVGLGTLYGPEDAVLERCDVDKAQELVVVERLMCERLRSVASSGAAGCGGATSPEAHGALLAALVAAALCLHCRPSSVAAAAGGARASFLQRDKPYKQRLKQITKQHAQPFVVRGHHLQLQALTSVGHCHHCDLVIEGLAPQAYVCADCKLRVHRQCAQAVEEGCCMDGEHHNNRISRFMERIHPNQPGLDSSDKKSKKASGTANFLHMERSFRKMEDEPPWDHTLTPAAFQERRDESDESLYESADCHSDAISASDDALPRLSKTPTMSKESLKLAVTDEEGDLARSKKGHRKTMSLSNPLEIVKCLGDELFDHKKDDKNFDKKKSRESLWSEEDRDSIHGSTMKLDQLRKNSKKEDKGSESRKNSSSDAPKRKSSKGSSVSALNFLRRKKTPTSMKAVEAVVEVVDGIVNTTEILNHTKFFLEEEKRFASVCQAKPVVDTDTDEDVPTAKVIGEHRRRLSRQTSRSKSKVRGKSQSLKVNTLRKSHSGTLKKGKKKSVKTPLAGRSRQASIVEPSPLVKKKHSDAFKQNSWLFSGSRGDSRREGSTDDTPVPDVDVDPSDATAKEPEKETNWKGASAGARGVNRAESCRERDAPRRGKHRNASDPNRLTAHHNHDLEPGAATAPSGSSSSSSLSSRSNESNTVATEHQASQSDWSEEEDPLAAQWSESLPPHIRDSIVLSARIRKRQEVIHELIVSEGSHVRWLKVLGVDFLKPLERQPALLPAEELRALFPNLPGVRERHARLYAELRSVRASDHVVQIRPVADAMLNTLGDAGYAACLARFCRGQRMALDALRERRRKHKELQQFLAGREQLPRCGRLQLRDLLACVWQRLTKYQLLLESVLKTVAEEDSEEGDSAEDVAQLRRALTVAKDVLHSVDTAIRTAENEHRLRSIQNKMEVRIPGGVGGGGGELEELRRLDLTAHALRHEGDLSLRTDTKKISVLALMLEDSLVLLQREGDKFVLRPLAQPSHAALLSPLIKWDKVLFRQNAAVRNTFFLMNINGIQMHELSANTTNEYLTWVKHIQESPLARLAEAKPSLTPSHQHTRSADDSGINVSRNPSDASEKSTSSAPPEDTCESERDRATPERDDASEGDKRSLERDDESNERDVESNERDKEDEEDRLKQTCATVGRISTHGGDALPALEPSAAVVVRAPPGAVHTAQRAFSHQERLRRLDEAISRALRAKSAVVAELLGVPPNSFTHLAELAIADTMGQVDICGALPARSADAPDLHQLLLAAQAQANQLTETLNGALVLSEASAVAARSGRCDSCRRTRHVHTETNDQPSEERKSAEAETDSRVREGAKLEGGAEADASYDMLADLSANEPQVEAPIDAETGEAGSARAAWLASRLVGGVCGVQAALAAMLGALPALERERRALRAEVAALRDRVDAARHRHDYQMTDEIFPKVVDQSIQDQPSNGG